MLLILHGGGAAKSVSLSRSRTRDPPPVGRESAVFAEFIESLPFRVARARSPRRSPIPQTPQTEGKSNFSTGNPPFHGTIASSRKLSREGRRSKIIAARCCLSIIHSYNSNYDKSARITPGKMEDKSQTRSRSRITDARLERKVVCRDFPRDYVRSTRYSVFFQRISWTYRERARVTRAGKSSRDDEKISLHLGCVPFSRSCAS